MYINSEKSNLTLNSKWILFSYQVVWENTNVFLTYSDNIYWELIMCQTLFEFIKYSYKSLEVGTIIILNL